MKRSRSSSLFVLAKDLRATRPRAVDGAREAGGLMPSWQGWLSTADGRLLDGRQEHGAGIARPPPM